MSAYNARRDPLAARAETAAILREALDGHRQEVPTDKSNLSRYLDGQCANPLEVIISYIEAIPADRAALIAGTISDAFEDAHGNPDETPLPELWARLDERDSGEDRERMDVAVSGFACETELRQWLRASREHARKAELVRRAAVRALAELRGRTTRRAYPATRQRKAVGS